MKRVLRYPGGKWNIAARIVDLIPKHHSYVEPFFGSGAVLFNKAPSDIETVNDLDSDVVNLFRCIHKDPERLAWLLMTTPFSREIYDSQFTGCMKGQEDPCMGAAGFLVRCWQGHGFRTAGGKVGWKNDVVGRERAYALRDWCRLPGWVIEIVGRLRMVQIENRPALEVIKRFDHPGVFQYWDPPYLLGTRNRKQYKHEMSDGDHEELLRAAIASSAKIMISGYESEMYNGYLQGWHKKYFKSCAEQGRPRTEVLWMNYRIGQMDIRDFIDEENKVCQLI